MALTNRGALLNLCEPALNCRTCTRGLASGVDPGAYPRPRTDVGDREILVGLIGEIERIGDRAAERGLSLLVLEDARPDT
jgi:hypothetical protein